MRRPLSLVVAAVENRGALVFHCNPFFDGPGATPFIPGGAIRGNCPAP
jgi:hypothetical protein